ncbi:MAG TPA: YciI family protein [bacterium]|nr:YciI family protein [bacterium]
MKYLLLIYYDEKALERLGKAEEKRIEDQSVAYTAQLQAEGKVLGEHRLRPVSTATCVRTQGGQKLVIDGPFAETKEQLGGYTLIDVKDLAEAIEIAKNLESGTLGAVEIRPIQEFGQY